MAERAPARQQLAAHGIRSPQDLAAWGRSRGLLGVYIAYSPAQQFTPACWQVVRPGHQTDPDAPGWQRGRKTFPVRSVTEKDRAERRARDWATSVFGVRGWVRVDGLGGTLFPSPIADELHRLMPDLTLYRRRQHT